jgi:hypothetical protein
MPSPNREASRSQRCRGLSAGPSRCSDRTNSRRGSSSDDELRRVGEVGRWAAYPAQIGGLRRNFR